MEKLLQSAKIRPRADCGLDHGLLIAKFRLKLKKVGKITKYINLLMHQISTLQNLKIEKIKSLLGRI